MKIAVVGIGVAGAYLLARLKNQHEVVGFERSTQENHDSICAWGTSKAPMQEFSQKVGLDFNDYVIHDGKQMYVDMGLERFQIKTQRTLHLQQNWIDKRHGKRMQNTLWSCSKITRFRI